MWDTLVVLEEGNHPLLCCPKCNGFVPWRVLNGKHHSTLMCAKEAERKIKWKRGEEAQARTAVAFQAYRRPLDTVTAFK